MKNRNPLLVRRIVMAVLGMALTGLSIGFFKRALFGTDPFQCFCNGLNNVLPISFGTLYMGINLILLALVFFLDRYYIGLSTLINVFLLGYMVSFFENIIAAVFGAPGLPVRIVFLIVGVVITCIAAALYYTADLGVSAYDAIPLYLAARKLKLGGRVLPFKLIRIGTDLICTLVGFVLGATVGIGTLVTALFMGPLISFFKRTISDPLLNR